MTTRLVVVDQQHTLTIWYLQGPSSMLPARTRSKAVLNAKGDLVAWTAGCKVLHGSTHRHQGLSRCFRECRNRDQPAAGSKGASN